VERRVILVSHAPLGIQHQRQWMEDNLVEPGEWYLSLDDNITDWTALVSPQYEGERASVKSRSDGALWKQWFCGSCPPKRLVTEIVPEMIAESERVGAHLAGFAVTDNYFYRERKWLKCAFVVTKACLRRKRDIRWDQEFSTMDDLDQTATHLLRDGVVLVNNFSVPEKKHYEAGGIGTWKERGYRKAIEAQRLCEKWPGLFTTVQRPNGHTDVSLAIDERSVEAWRKRMVMRGQPTLFPIEEFK